MRKIHDYIDRICDELDDAKEYAERYILNKGWNQQWGKMYHEMAEDELKHAEYLKQIATEHIGMLDWIPDESRYAWDACVAGFSERAAVIRLMLSK